MGTTNITEATARGMQPQGLLSKLGLEVSRKLWYPRTRATLVTACKECKSWGQVPKGDYGGCRGVTGCV